MKKLLNLSQSRTTSSLFGVLSNNIQQPTFFGFLQTQQLECINTQKRFGSKHLYIRGKLHYEKKLEQEKKVSKLSEKSKAAYRSNAERSQNFGWTAKTATEELYQSNMLEFKNTRKRPSAQQFLTMLSTVQSTSDLSYAMRYWRTLCLRRIKFTSQSTEAILEALEKYDESHPATAIECK